MDTRVKFTWDKGIDFDEFADYIRQQLRLHYPPDNRKEEATFCYYSILAVQLANGLRISEAIEAFKKYLESGKRIVEVTVRKKRVHAETRPVKIPRVIKDEYRWAYTTIKDTPTDVLIKRIKAWASKHKHNTHSLRYAWITKQLLSGKDPMLVAKAVRHSSPNITFAYAQKLKADQIILDSDLE